MTEIETLRNFINENLETIKSGTREDAIALLKNYCEEHNVLDHDVAHTNHYFAITESGDDVVDADPISYMNQAGCPGTEEGAHAFQMVYVAPTLEKDGFKIMVCTRCGDASFWEDLYAYGRDYSGTMKVGFYASQLIMDTDNDISCFLPEAEEKSEEEFVVDDTEAATEEEVNTVETVAVEEIQGENSVQTKSVAPFVFMVGVLLLVVIGVIMHFRKRNHSQDN